MGDMSDLPNFKRSWIRRVGWMRLILVVVGVLTAALVWVRGEELPSDIKLELHVLTSSDHLLIGQPIDYSLRISNDGAQTALFDVQAAIQLIEGSCLQTGQNSKKIFSLPHKISVGPNSNATVNGTLEPILPCDGKARVGTIGVLKIDTNSMSFEHPGPSFEVL